MQTIGRYNYFVYIMTNFERTVLYTGVTNDLLKRIEEHQQRNLSKKSFTGRYNVHFLVYWEHFTEIKDAIHREKEIKGWSREKKNNLILGFNPDWKFLNDEIY